MKKELRWWWYWGHNSNNSFHLQIARPKFSISFGMSGHGEDTLHGSFCGIYWSLNSWALSKKLPTCKGNSFRFYWFHNALWFSLWSSDWESCRTDPWWRQMHAFHFDDFFLGDFKHCTKDIEVIENVIIPMPEGNFKATVTFQECISKRSRWFSKTEKYSDIKLDKDAPKFPGKGESDWDCGDDAVHGMSVKGHSLPKAIAGYVQTVLEYREKRQGRGSLIYSAEKIQHG